jgi:hypothetical protein
VLENIIQLRLKGPCSDQVDPLQTAETAIKTVSEFRDRLENLVRESPPDNRGLLQDSLHIRFHMVEPGRDNSIHSWRYV